MSSWCPWPGSSRNAVPLFSGEEVRDQVWLPTSSELTGPAHHRRPRPPSGPSGQLPPALTRSPAPAGPTSPFTEKQGRGLHRPGRRVSISEGSGLTRAARMARQSGGNRISAFCSPTPSDQLGAGGRPALCSTAGPRALLVLGFQAPGCCRAAIRGSLRAPAVLCLQKRPWILRSRVPPTPSPTGLTTALATNPASGRDGSPHSRARGPSGRCAPRGVR